ncbi:universal stress protein [Ghiorsea bivora]|uniref:universal stress protein n=1 Tax=Ghiorsea bivora TaxID=1485545 RepID=UPI000571DE02|nr:universal stress protein [Ghiorsea bivora]
MIKEGKIIVPTDFSKQSDEALRRAVVLAVQLHADIHLIHVIEPPVFVDGDLILISPMDDTNKAQHQMAQKRLNKQAASVDIPIIIHLEDTQGSPARTICNFAQAMPADLIIIGRHGEKGVLEHLLLGSTAERVVQHAPCSVLVTMPHGILANQA